MTSAERATFNAARKAVTDAIDAFVTDATPGTGLPALATALQTTRQAIDPQFPILGGADDAMGALYRAIVVYLNSRRIAGASTLRFPWP